MESSTVSVLGVGYKFKEFKEETYVHHIILPENLPFIFNEMRKSCDPNKDALSSKFRFNYGELLSKEMIHHEFFFQYASGKDYSNHVLKENFSNLKNPIMVGKVHLTTFDFTRKELRSFPMYRHKSNPQEWTAQSYDQDHDGMAAEIKITITVVKRWAETLGSSVVQRRAGKRANMGKTSELAKYFLNPKSSDMEIQCGGSKIAVHKSVLSRNPIFGKMFKQGGQSVIEIQDIQLQIVKLLLEFIYTDKVDTDNLDVETQKKLLVAAYKYMIDDLRDDCAYSLGNQLMEQNDVMKIIEMYKFAEKYDALVLKDACKEWFKKMKKTAITDVGTFARVAQLVPELMFAAFSD